MAIAVSIRDPRDIPICSQESASCGDLVTFQQLKGQAKRRAASWEATWKVWVLQVFVHRQMLPHPAIPCPSMSAQWAQ